MQVIYVVPKINSQLLKKITDQSMPVHEPTSLVYENEKTDGKFRHTKWLLLMNLQFAIFLITFYMVYSCMTKKSLFLKSPIIIVKKTLFSTLSFKSR